MSDAPLEQLPEPPSDDTQSEISEAKPRPFLKWAGGKSHLVPEILRRAPANYSTYFEPFLGGGAVYFALLPKKAVLSDVNPDLINAFSVVRDKVDDLVDSLSRHQHSKRYFYKLRQADRSPDFWVHSDIEKASRLIYLNKTCYNGLYRVNSRGEFNVPFGDYENPRILDDGNLFACHDALKAAELVCGSFASIEDRIQKDDFVYCDPPYVPASKTANFASYTKDGFSDAMHDELAEFCKRIDKKGAKFLLSNSATALTRELYSSFTIDTVEAPRAINSKAEKRGRVEEILVRNYELP